MYYFLLKYVTQTGNTVMSVRMCTVYMQKQPFCLHKSEVLILLLGLCPLTSTGALPLDSWGTSVLHTLWNLDPQPQKPGYAPVTNIPIYRLPFVVHLLHYICWCLYSCISYLFVYVGKTFIVSLAGIVVWHCPLLVHVHKTARRCSACWCFGFMQQFIGYACYDIACIWGGKYVMNLTLTNEQHAILCIHFTHSHMLLFVECYLYPTLFAAFIHLIKPGLIK